MQRSGAGGGDTTHPPITQEEHNTSEMLREMPSLRKMPAMKVKSLTELAEAVRDGNVSAVREFAESPPGHPATTPSEKWITTGYKLLNLALAGKEYEIAHLLLNKVPQVNSVIDIYEHTPLHYAVADNQEELARLLLERDAEVDAIDEHDMTPLHYAVLMDNLEIVKMLLERGAKPHETPDHVFRFTPFQHACKSSKSQILEEFLIHGSDANSIFENPDNLICPKFTSPLHMAITQLNLESIQLLLKYDADVNHVNANKESCLHLACRENSEEIVRLLLNHRAKLNVQSKDGSTPLHLAVRRGKEEIVMMLLVHGADATLADRDGQIALQLAVEERRPRIVEMLLAREPDTEISRQAFKKALLENGLGSDMFKCFVKRGFVLSTSEICEVAFSAIERGYFHIVEALLRYAEEIGKEDLLLEARNAENGDTLLHCATKRSQHDIVRLLISKKADVQALDEAGNPPVLYAIENDDDHIVKTFITKGDDVCRYPLLLHTIVQTKKKRVRPLLELVLQSGADVNQVDPDLCDSTVLHLICREPMEKDSELVELLLRYGADVNAPASDGSTALHILASRDDSVEILRVLLRHDPSLEARDAQGSTALHVAASEARHQNIQALLEAGASINATDDLGMTPLDVAAAVARSLPPGDLTSIKYEKEVTASLVLLRREAVKRDVAKMRLVDGNLKYLTEEDDKEYRKECHAELELIDACSINSNVTLRDVLVRNARKIVRHMREETAKSSFEKTQYANKYPIYGRLIDGATGRIMREYKINMAKAAMPVLCGYGLPDACTESIFVYLRTSELENLSIATTIQIESSKSP